MIGKKRGSYALLCTAQNLGAVCPPPVPVVETPMTGGDGNNVCLMLMEMKAAEAGEHHFSADLSCHYYSEQNGGRV